MKTHFISRLKDFACVPFVDSQDNWNGEDWITLSHLIARLENGKILTVPSGFVSNFGSISKPLRPFLNRMGNSLRAYVVHDWLYSALPEREEYGFSQRECDKILYNLSLEDGESFISAQTINKGLLLGGWTHFKKNKPVVKPVSRSVLKFIVESNKYHLEDW